MTESYEAHQKWLEERFNHLNTILKNIQRTVDELKESRTNCIARCNTKMNEVYHRLREVERRQAAKNGAEEHKRDFIRSRNLTWQMIIALGSALSAAAIFVGYLMGKG